MAFALRENLFFCLTDRCAIFLDLAGNRYFGLTGTADLALRRIVAGDALEPELKNALKPLLTKGFLSEVEQAAPLAAISMDAPTGALELGAHPTRRDRLSALIYCCAIAIELRVSGLKAMVQRRIERKTAKALVTAASIPIEMLQRVAAAHRRVDHVVGAADRCLGRSFAMIDHFAAHGYFPDLVIGIRTSAFSAHCWVQSGPTILNDDLDRVSLFTPILRV